MTRPPAIDLSPEDRGLVLRILRTNLPAGTKVWAFGSRASGRARPYSDLDLSIDCGRRLSLDETAALREAFTGSDLPYKVDIVDWRAIDDSFRKLIAAERLPLLKRTPRVASGRLADVRRRTNRLEGSSILDDLSRDRKREAK